MEKTIICDYWKKKNCKYMNNSKNCIFAHGIEELKNKTCIYGTECYNINCKFDHGNVSITPDIVYDIPITIKRKNKNKKIKIKNIDEDIIKNKDLSKEEMEEMEEMEEIQIIKIINKNKGIYDSVNVSNTSYNKMLSIVDDFYIKKYDIMVYSKNKSISRIINNNYKLISSLRKSINIYKDENISLKKENDDINNNIKKIVDEALLKQRDEFYIKFNKLNNEYISLKEEKEKINTISIMEEKKITKNKYSKNIDKLKTLYNKYINIYNLINYHNDYKLINLDEIRKYSKDNNIYKLKQRSEKVYNYYNKLKSGIIKEYLPIYKIFKMV